MNLLGDGFATVLKFTGMLTAAYILLLWLASVLWAFRDIRSRTLNPVSQVIGVAVVALMPFFGVAIYLIVRPSETLVAAYERELEQEAIRSELHALVLCPSCRRPIEGDFIVCAYCRTPVREECARCRKLLSLDWRHCPFCGASRPVRQEPISRAPASGIERNDAREADGPPHTGNTPGAGAAQPMASQRPRRVQRDD